MNGRQRTVSNESPQSHGIVDEATTAQIDTLILDNRKKLNQIIGKLFYIILST